MEEYLKLLLENLKTEGIEILEEEAKKLVNVTIDTAIVYVKKQDNELLKSMVIPALEELRKKGLVEAEKINPADNN